MNRRAGALLLVAAASSKAVLPDALKPCVISSRIVGNAQPND
ncbi:hypothetical protein RYH73_18130 [Olivibacter sp. CPCC 100613]